MKIFKNPTFRVITVVVILIILVGSAVLLWKKGADKNNSATEAEPVHNEIQSTEIYATDKGFNPDNMTVKKGTVVVWKNQSSEPISINSADHDDHKLHPELNLGFVEATGGSTQVLLEKPGTYKYHNHFKPEQGGTIIVIE